AKSRRKRTNRGSKSARRGDSAGSKTSVKRRIYKMRASFPGGLFLLASIYLGTHVHLTIQSGRRKHYRRTNVTVSHTPAISCVGRFCSQTPCLGTRFTLTKPDISCQRSFP